MRYDRAVAPPAGAWIETLALQAWTLSKTSRPLRARGLKHHAQQAGVYAERSRPLRARGLKQKRV